MPARPALLLTLLACAAAAQTPLHPIPALAPDPAAPVLREPVQRGEPFTVAGPQGVLVGQQQGELEAWLLPVKLLSHLTLEANVAGYSVPIVLNDQAREIEVRPESTTITYSHIAVVVRQTMFAADQMPAGTGAVVLFQVDSPRAVDLTLCFTPEMKPMWPEPDVVAPSPEWVPTGSSGYYVLHTDFPTSAAAVALPGAQPGILAPYQERPQFHPLEFKLHTEPADRARMFPLLMAVGRTQETARSAALFAKLAELNDRLPQIFAAHVRFWRDFEATHTAIVTPDKSIDSAFQWAAASIEQLRARTSGGETALVAGYYASGDSARPGFGWFFGRDALYTLYAVHGIGDFELSKSELSFLLKRQRADGKIMHEYSQTADEVDWSSLPYEYAAADATPLFLLAMLDYVKSSGDVDFLRQHREAVLRAWRFETSHDADGDGIYDNAEGTGWVESWPTGMPRQEIYLALLDQQASAAVAELATLLNQPDLAAGANKRAETLHRTIEREYYSAAIASYAFSRNGSALDATRTVFPSVAWWSSGAALDHASEELRLLAGHDFATDWGERDVAASEPLYDGLSYHQGSVWPLFTGWQALAEYRGGQPLPGYQALMRNVDLTTAQDPGAVTELLSGDVFEPFGRSTSHQLWSSAMVITPLLRGLFGIELDGAHHSLRVTPQLPPDWDHAEVDRLHLGASIVDIHFERSGSEMLVKLQLRSGPQVALEGAATDGALHLPLPPVAVILHHELPLRGARTAQFKVLAQQQTDHSLTLELEGIVGTEAVLPLRLLPGVTNLHAEGADLTHSELHITFAAESPAPTTTTWVRKTITLRW